MTTIHGGDWVGYQLEYGREPLDFSANTSSLGFPPGVRRAVIDSLETVDRYPDPKCRALRFALSERHQVPADRILCGNGAADLIEHLIIALRPKQALILAPSFGEYADALRRFDCAVREYQLSASEGFRVTERILDALEPSLDLLILCEPNNPTGVTTDRGLLKRILAKCRSLGCFLMIDECFNSFLDEPEAHSMISELSGGGLLLLRAFTKFYGMAGLRLGYCLCADSGFLCRVAEAGQPWAVSTPAQAAGIAALNETEYAAALRRLIREERPKLIDGLRALGCEVIPGEANYLLFRSEVEVLGEKLKEKGILIRSCWNYTGLDAYWYRVAVRSADDNQRLLNAIKEVL